MLHQTAFGGTLWLHSSTKGTPMLSDHQRDAVKWFINRFVQSRYGQQLLLRREGFEPIMNQKEFVRQTRRFPELKFSFVPANETQIVIQATTEQAQWAEGVIYRDEKGDLHYLSGHFELKADIRLPIT